MRNICILILLLLFITPLCGQLLQYVYYPYTNVVNWNDAQAFCRKNHIDLATIEDDQDDANAGRGWIGLYRKDSSSPWKWSGGDELGQYNMWGTGEPKSDNSKNCVYKHDHWHNDDCTTGSDSFTCHDVLILVKENKTWDEALDYCRSLGGVDTVSSYRNHSYDLATLITPEIQATARNSTQLATTDEVWTGMRFLAGKWLWVGGEQMQYKNLPSCPTNGSCGVFEKNSKSFSTRDCQQQRNFFCYKRPQTQ